MRRITFGLLFAGLLAGACGRANPTASASAMTPADQPVATSGEAAAPREGGTPDRSPAVHEITLPVGTRLPIVLDTTVGSDISKIEQPVRAHLSRAVVIDGKTVLAEGTRLSGVVTDATRSGKVKGRAHVSVRFDTLVPAGADERYQVDTSAVGRTAPATKKKDAMEIGGGAAGGALIGAIVGGKKGAAIGTAAGGGAGTAVVLSTRGKEIRLPRGSAMTLKLVKPLTVRVKA
jgi:hypothetical protein